MKMIVVKLVCGVQFVKRLRKISFLTNFRRKCGKLKQIRKFFRGLLVPLLCPKSCIKIGLIRCVQLLNAKIYPDRFLEHDPDEKNLANVEGSETENLPSKSTQDIDPYDAYPCQSDEVDDTNESMCMKPNCIAGLELNFDEKFPCGRALD